MNFASGKLLHIGINYTVAPVSEINEQKEHEFQGHLMQAGLGIRDKRFESNRILASRKEPTPLQIQVETVGPQVAQVLVIAPNPNRAFEVFVEEANAAIGAFKNTWIRQSIQIISSDATIRYLYDSDRDHAFAELWEDKLGMPRDALAVFGRPVSGGGLRFVMPQRENEEDPKRVEVKIESFLRDPKQIFVEVQFVWENPSEGFSVSDFHVAERLKNLESFIENRVHKFMERS
jgi:hypothetical protein